MIKPEECTIIIPHYGATKEQCYSLNECVKSLKEATDIKIIVVKNGNIPCQCDRDLRIIEQGQCKAVNAAVAITNTPWIFVTNDDMIYYPNWWEDLTEGVESKMCVSPKLVEPRPGAPTFEVFPCGGAGGDFNKDKWLGFARNYPAPNSPIRTGFNLPLLIKRELWDIIGGYDINYDPWGSNGDSDLEYKIKLAGVQSYQNQNCLVYHFSQTSGTFHPDNRGFWDKNWHYFISKWGFERASTPFIWEANFDIPKENKYHPEWEGKYVKA